MSWWWVVFIGWGLVNLLIGMYAMYAYMRHLLKERTRRLHDYEARAFEEITDALKNIGKS